MCPLVSQDGWACWGLPWEPASLYIPRDSHLLPPKGSRNVGPAP